jgi:hypothetical protein
MNANTNTEVKRECHEITLRLTTITEADGSTQPGKAHEVSSGHSCVLSKRLVANSMLRKSRRCTMRRNLTLTIAALAAIVGPMGAQTNERRATLSGSAVSGDQGKCTVEVVVDGTVDVEIRGDRGILRNVIGGAPQWRRFECTGPLPSNPTEFKFSGVDGRGSQQLARDPRTSGIAVVRITDSQGGSEGYTFDVTWSGGSTDPRQNGNDSIFSDSRNSGGRGRRISSDEAIRVCQDAVRQEAAQRFNSSDIEFRTTSIEDNRGSRDLVAGTFVIRNSNVNDNSGRRNGNSGRQNAHRFSCSMNFNNGRLQAVQIDQQQSGSASAPLYGDRGISPLNAQAARSCERAVQDRVRRDGYQRIAFGKVNSDSNNRILGTITADNGNTSDVFDFVCTVNGNSGTVRSLEVKRR